MSQLTFRALALLFFLFVAVAGGGGWYAFITLSEMQRALPVETLAQHRTLTSLTDSLSRLSESVNAMRVEPSAQHRTRLMLSLDIAHVTLAEHQHTVETQQGDSDLHAAIEEGQRVVAELDARLESPSELTPQHLLAQETRLGDTVSLMRTIYLRSNETMLGVINRQIEQMDSLGKVVLVSFVTLLLSLVLMVVLIAWQRRAMKALSDSQEARQGSEMRFRTMVDNAGDAIYIHDRYGKLHVVNQVASEQTGYSIDELLKMSVAQLDAAIDIENLRETWDLGEANPENFPMTLETAHRRKDGSVFPIEVRISLLPSEGVYALRRHGPRHYRPQGGRKRTGFPEIRS